MSDQNISSWEKYGWRRVVLHNLSRVFHWSIVGVAILCCAFMFMGIFMMIPEFTHFKEAVLASTLHDVIEHLLADILLIVVGFELAIMLIKRTPESLVDVMFFVVARKMLIKSDNFYDILIGVAALAGLFAIRKYLETHKRDKKEASPQASSN
jgi:hypothetical protein